jgi:phage-related minor tail protein
MKHLLAAFVMVTAGVIAVVGSLGTATILVDVLVQTPLGLFDGLQNFIEQIDNFLESVADLLKTLSELFGGGEGGD